MHLWYNVSICFYVVLLSLVSLYTAGYEAGQSSPSREVRVFVDDAGRLHWQGRVFAPKKPSRSGHGASKVAHCSAGDKVNVSYGRVANHMMELPKDLIAEGILTIPCSEAFEPTDSSEGDVFGNLIVSCSTSGHIAVKYHCGCSAGPVPIPVFSSPESFKKMHCDSTDEVIGTPGVLWSSADLLEGETQERPCYQLGTSLSGVWQLRCHRGRLCIDAAGCRHADSVDTSGAKAILPSRESVNLTSGLARDSTSPLKYHRNFSSYRRGNARHVSLARRLLRSRRLTPVPCQNPPADAWWPTICKNTEGVPYSTVAGARLPGSGLLQLKSAHGVFVSHFTGDIFIADWGNHRIQKWTNEGSSVTVAGTSGQTGIGTDTSLLFNPSDVYIAGEARNNLFGCGELFIADEGNHRILRWPPGALKGFVVAGGVEDAGDGLGQLNKPSGIWVTDDLEVYIADQLNNRVVMWSKQHRKLIWQYNKTVAGRSDTQKGNALDLLDHPTDVAVDEHFTGDKAVYVADKYNDRIVKWADGATTGIVVGTCFAPSSVYIDIEGYVFAACTTSNCIKRWSYINGAWVAGMDTGECGIFGSAPHIDDPGYLNTVDRFFAPQGTFVDRFGNVFVSDTTNARVIKRGRSALTQWILSNAVTTQMPWTVTSLGFYENLACDATVTIKSYITSDGAYSEPWSPICSKEGEGRCARDEGWIGRQFIREGGIRCIKATVVYTDPTGALFRLNSRYWFGTGWETVYTFGGIISGVETTLRFPRFDDPVGPKTPICVKGRRQCIWTDLTGDWQHDGDKIMIKTITCNGNRLQGLPSSSVTDPATSGGTVFKLGDDSIPEVVSADASSGGEYLMCWCDGQRDLCQLSSEFSIYLGSMRLEGPKAQQSLYGWRGQPLLLNLQSDKGVGLVANDRMTVVFGNCGLSATDVQGIPKQPGALIAYSMPSTNGFQYSWGQDYVTANPGLYNLCWCRPGTCEAVADFQAASGDITINGPNPRQVFSCTKGEICDLQITGVGFELADRIMVLTRCGQEPAASGFPKNIGEGSAANTNFGSAGSSVEYTYGAQASYAPVGLYFVCWCAKLFDCDVPSQFLAEVGVLTVSGPEPTPLDCAIGAECVVKNIQGVRLEQSSRAVVIPSTSKCGDAGVQAPYLFPGDPTVMDNGVRQYGISFAARDAGTTYDWGMLDTNIVVPAAYTACWCHDGRNCTFAEDFRVELGELTVRGPYRWNESAVCGSGKDCAVIVSGWALAPTDRMLIMTGTCGEGGTIAIGAGTAVADAESRSDTGMNHVWSAERVPPGGNYIVCWCSTTVGICATKAAFRMRVGSLIISAPNQDHDVSCTSGNTCIITLNGFGLQATDKIGWVSTECGTNDFVKGVPNQAVSTQTFGVGALKQVASFKFGYSEAGGPVTAIGGRYTLCWCPYRCNLMQDFAFKTGYVNVMAPSRLHYYVCWNGLPCSIAGIGGLGLQNSDKVRVASNCLIETIVGGMPMQGISLNATDIGTAFSWGPNIIGAIVGAYDLCWCSAYHTCKEMLDFATNIGTLIVGGPTAGQTVRCEAGFACQIDNVTGYALRLGDKISLLQTCGTGNPIFGWSTGQPWYPYPPFLGHTSCDLSLNTSDLPCAHFLGEGQLGWRLMADPGTYRMCWCSVTNPSGCQTVEDFSIDMGLFTAVGALPGQTFVCAPGFLCRINYIQGVSLRDNDLYLVQNGTDCEGNTPVTGMPAQGISMPAAPPEGSKIEWQGAISNKIRPAMYILCWCPYTLFLQCNSPDNLHLFVTDSGSLSIIGPYPGHYYKAYVGNKVMIDQVKGHGLQNLDRIIVVNGTCGANTTIIAPHFPGKGLSNAATEGGTIYQYDYLVKAISGHYRICWCGASQELDTFSCFDESVTKREDESGDNFLLTSFQVDLGELFIPEIPAPDEKRDCISGMHCYVDGLVGSTNQPLPDNARILIKKPDVSLPIENGTCIEPSGSSTSTASDQFPNNGASDPATLEGTYYEWGNVSKAIWANGGRYLMCWKPQEAELYGYLLGLMDVTGPVKEISGTAQSFNCIKSAICELSKLAGQTVELAGFGLQDGDYYRVMLSCAADLDQEEAAGLLIVGIDAVRMTNNVVRWNKEIFQGNPGLYKLCWCSGGQPCGEAGDFRTEAGDIAIYGPTPGQNRKCDRGQDCLVENITGLNLDPKDQAQILVECDTGPEVDGFKPKAVQALEQANNEFQFFWQYVTSLPGIFRICWCEAKVCGATDELQPMSSFDVEIGIITVQGPDNHLWLDPPPSGEGPLHGYQWNMVVKGVNLQVSPAARIRIMVQCPTNNTPGIPVEGFDAVAIPTDSSGSRYMIEEDIMYNITPATWQGYWQDVEYKLCWCRGPTALDPTDHCETESKFSLTFGSVVVSCAEGMEPKGDGCSFCKIGEFKEKHSNENCEECPPLMTTAVVGTIYETRCYCIAGYYLKDGVSCKECPENQYCPGGFKPGTTPTQAITDEDHQQPVDCPANSGAWRPDEGCTYTGKWLGKDLPNSGLLCTGRFPAQTASDCSCIEGYQPDLGGRKICVACALNYFKPYRGNETQCELCESIYAKSSTEEPASDKCTCRAGLYMVTASSDKPAFTLTSWVHPTQADLQALKPPAFTKGELLRRGYDLRSENGGDCVADTSTVKSNCVLRYKLSLFCTTCPVGSFCPGPDKATVLLPADVGSFNACPPGTGTPSAGSTSSADCQCSAGYFRDTGTGNCIGCPASDPAKGIVAVVYKGSTGDQPCSELCPTNSKIPFGVVAAKGPENCLCDPGYQQILDWDTLEFSCELLPPGTVVDETVVGRTSVELSAVYGEFYLEYVANDTETISKDLPLLISSELGLPDASSVSVHLLEWIYVEDAEQTDIAKALAQQRRLKAREAGKRKHLRASLGMVSEPVFEQYLHKLHLAEFQRRLNSSNETSSNATSSNATNGTATENQTQSNVSQNLTTQPNVTEEVEVKIGKAKVQVTIWQSTVAESINLMNRFNEKGVGEGSIDSGQIREELLRTNSDFYGNLKPLVDGGLYFNYSNTRIDKLVLDCYPHSAIPDGYSFVSIEESCVCSPGYEPFDDIAAQFYPSQDDITQYNAEYRLPSSDEYKLLGPMTCVACYAPGGRGKYKDSLGNTPCVECPLDANNLLISTMPYFGANHSDQCICDMGMYRDGTNIKCVDCPVGHWCTGETTAYPCPPNEWSIDMKLKDPIECLCDKGYFRSLQFDEISNLKECLPCDDKYFKDKVDDGIGRCTEICTTYYGMRSTSPKGARSQDECVCEKEAYMKQDSTKVSGETCAMCPRVGVECTGGKTNVTRGGVTNYTHAPPVAKPGFFMLNLGTALVEECLTQTTEGTSVCLGANECSEGQEGLICGNCMKGYTRDKFPKPCKKCSDMPGDGVLVLKLMFDFTAYACLNQFLAVSALSKTETQKNVLTVLLRMFQHWSTQVGVLSSNFNLSKLQPMTTNTEEEEEETENTTAVGPDTNWPPWFGSLTGKVLIFAEVLESLGSQQEVIECIIDRKFPDDSEDVTAWKLIGPAIWWFLYPAMLVGWTIMFAHFQGFVIVPALAFLYGQAKKKRKKKRPADPDRAKRRAQKKRERAARAEENQDSESDSQTSSSSEGENHAFELGDVSLHHPPRMLPMADALTSAVATPRRFNIEYTPKEAVDEDLDNKAKSAEYILQLFPVPATRGWPFILAIFPWIIITLNNSWNTVTTRMLQLLNCEQFRWSGDENPPPEQVIEVAGFMLMHPNTKCMTFIDSEHGFLAIISVSGLLLWSLGIVALIYFIVNGRDLQKPFVTRNFGYLLEGYEPQFWYWELWVKKVDLLATALITYTSITNDPRAKILLYSVQAAIFYGLQLFLSPYDNRSLLLLDRMENTGLLVRECLFTGIAFCLLFDTSKSITLVISALLLVANGWFVVSVFWHMADDFVSTQVALTSEARTKARLEAKRKIILRRRKDAIEVAMLEAGGGGRRVTPKARQQALQKAKWSTEVDESLLKPKPHLEMKYKLMIWVQKSIFSGGNLEGGYRHSQLLRCVWNGPGSDAQFFIPNLYDGYPIKRKMVLRTALLKATRSFYGISEFAMLKALTTNVSSFVDLLINLAEFRQCPARLTDMIFFLARAVKLLKKNIEEHPNMARILKKTKTEAGTDDPTQDDRFERFSPLEELKIALLQEMFQRLLFETRDKRILLETVRTGHLRDTLVREKVPLDAAWDIMEKLTKEQLNRAQKHAVEMYSRVDFNITLSMCSEQTLNTIKASIKKYENDKHDRKRINNFLKFHLRECLDQDPDLDWHEIHQMLNLLPIVELNRLTEDPDKVVQLAKKQKQDIEAEQAEKGFQGDPANILTIEDLNSMLMFLQKLPYDELHLVIEFTQLLLDFLSLPAHAKWRDEVVMRGRREEEAPKFYKGMFALRQQLEKYDQEQQELEEKAELEDANKDKDVPEKRDLKQLEAELLDSPPELGTQMNRMLHDTAALREDVDPRVQLRRIMSDHAAEQRAPTGDEDEEPSDIRSEGSISLNSLESIDSAVRIPQTGQIDTPAEDSVDDSAPMWRRIDNLRSRALGMINSALPDEQRSLPMLTGINEDHDVLQVGGNNRTTMSIDDAADMLYERSQLSHERTDTTTAI